MQQPIIEIKNVGKRYTIGHEREQYLALRDVITGAFVHPLRLMKRKARQAIGFDRSENFWALKDVSLSVRRGEVLGIIGRNGAGKSTLLKILSQITPPTEGEIVLRGRVGSLLEVGTGFHAELTGRENIFLNGAILGMTKKEITRKFEAIIEFAGVEKFLDTPVKRYSSGMYVRLAFAVAAHMEPDILIVDEVLAVGDADFQRKCLNKMEEVTHENGRTIIFVSHNLEAVQMLCKTTALIDGGKIVTIGLTQNVIEKYLLKGGLSKRIETKKRLAEIEIKAIESLQKTARAWVFEYEEEIVFRIELEALSDVQQCRLGVSVNSAYGERLAATYSDTRTISKGHQVVDVHVANVFTPGTYTLSLDALNLFRFSDFTTIHVLEKSGATGTHPWEKEGVVRMPAHFEFHQGQP